MKRSISFLALAVSSIALGGCQALFGSASFADRTPAIAEPETLDMSDYFAARLAAGKLHLESGRPAQAVTAFRQASYDPQYTGQAYNGMGVAYARLGRDDLARRYFMSALARQPEDERIVRNLARLERSSTPEINPTERAEVAPVPVHVPSSYSSAAFDEQGPGESRLRRVSPREVQIELAAAGQSDKTVSTARVKREVHVSQVARTSDYPVRIQLPRDNARGRSDYPVRIALSEVKTSKPSRYPVRIELPNSQ